MKLDDDLVKRLRAIFASEAQEQIAALDRALLALEKKPDADQRQALLAEIFRVAHTLKGSARAVDLQPVGALAHCLETLFARLQRGELQLEPEILDQVYHALDALGALVSSPPSEIPVGRRSPWEKNGPGSGVNVEALCADLAGLGQEVGARSPRPYSDGRQGDGEMGRQGDEETDRLPTPQVTGDETVRVAVAKLDALLAQTGELQVTRIGAEQRLVEARELLERIEAWEAEWRRVRNSPAYRSASVPSHGDLSVEEWNIPEGRSDSAHLSPYWMAHAGLFEFLALNDTRLRETRVQLEELRRHLEADTRRFSQVTADLQEDVRRTRMMPAATIFDSFPRMVRDLARALGKEVQLELRGGETEVDRSVLEQIKAPLLHLLRNAVDHGIEPPDERQHVQDKPREGVITLTASQRGGNSIVFEVADDGAGIDPARVKASAVKKGLLTPEAAHTLNDQEALWLIFRSGLSTSAIISDVSGRGVGLDVVRENVERLQGVVELDTRLGQGTRVSLRLPLTVATTLCLLARAGGETFAIPIVNVARIVRVQDLAHLPTGISDPRGSPTAVGDPRGTGLSRIGYAQGREVIQDDGRPVALLRLNEALGLPARSEITVKKKGAQSLQDLQLPRGSLTSQDLRPALILGAAERSARAAFLVDELVGAQEVLIKSLPRPLVRVRHIAGATILGTGSVVMVLHVADLLRTALTGSLTRAPLPGLQATKVVSTIPVGSGRPAVILIVDDSITTRTLEKNIIEMAGYQVVAVGDGLEAWTRLQSDGCAPEGMFSLVVSDIKMPRLDGFELTSRARADDHLKHLPIILVTSLDARQDRERGIAVGADAYIVKSAFDQDDLLATIRQLIG